MFYSEKDIKRIEDFQKYARFICQHFDIQVELDSTKAQTNGRVISLPNIIDMNETEVDMMYAILLHEAGHIKYSIFTEEAFAKIRTQAHAYLSNAIEDARIENLLMEEFPGAEEMFENLYCKYAVDKRLMKKVFNLPSERPDLFNTFALYIHSRLINCRTAPFSRVATAKNYKKIKSFFIEKNIMDIIEKSPLNNWDNVIELTNALYDEFVSYFKEKSAPTNFAENLEIKSEANNAIDKLKNDIENAIEQTSFFEEQLKQRQKSYDAWESTNQPIIDRLEQDISSLNNECERMKESLKNKQRISDHETQIRKTIRSVIQDQKKSSDLQTTIEQIKQMLDSKINAKGKSLTEKQKITLEKDINRKKLLKDRVDANIKQSNEKKTEQQKVLEQLNNSYDPYKQYTKDTLEQKIKHINEKQLPQKNKDLGQLHKVKNEFLQELNNLQKYIDDLTEIIQKNIIDTLYDLDNRALENDFPINILPEFQETDGWEKADQAQQEFDKKASKEKKQIVRNGAKMSSLLGSNLRDISIYLDKTQEKVENINLLDIFKSQANISRLNPINETDYIVNNTSVDKSVSSYATSIQTHTVLTKQFDTITKENHANIETRELFRQHQDFIVPLNQLFLKKLKFSKKDYFRGGKEEGQLDTRNLWKLATRTDNDYYEVNNPKPINKIAASILIDISGSLDKENTGYGEKLKVITLALSEALKSVHIKHEILGHHAPLNIEMRAAQASYSYNRRANHLETVVYKNFSQKDNLGIGNIEIKSSDNSDGEAIRIAVNRLKREQSKSKVLFIITDAKPFLSDSNIVILDEDLKSALREAVYNKVQVFAFGFSPHGTDFYGDRFCHVESYTDIIKFLDKNI